MHHKTYKFQTYKTLVKALQTFVKSLHFVYSVHQSKEKAIKTKNKKIK